MANTIPALKRNFLASQVRILNTPLEAPEDWREASRSPEEGELSDRVVDEVVRKGKLSSCCSFESFFFNHD